MPIPELTLLILLFVLGIAALVAISLVITSIVSGTLFLKGKSKRGKKEGLPDKETLQGVK